MRLLEVALVILNCSSWLIGFSKLAKSIQVRGPSADLSATLAPESPLKVFNI